MAVDKVITNTSIVTMDPAKEVIKKGFVAINGNKIVDVDCITKFKKPPSAKIRIDARGMVTLPGLINTHVHLYQNFLKGMQGASSLVEWCDKGLFPFVRIMKDPKFKKLGIGYHASLMACLEMIKSGTTCCAAFDFDPGVPKAIEESRMRAIFMPFLADQWAPKDLLLEREKRLKETELLLEKWHDPESRIRCMVALAAPFICSDELMLEAKKIADKFGVGLAMHILETQYEARVASETYGKKVLEHLEETKLLNEKFLAIHCVWVDDNDIQIMKKHDVKVSHNPESNMRLASGVAPVPKMLSKGLTVGLATDGAASNDNLDMFEAMRAALMLHRVTTLDPSIISPQKVLEMATIDAAKTLGLDREIGSIEIGKNADLTIVDMRKPHLQPVWDLVSNLVLCANGADVDTVIVDGEILMKRRKLTRLNESDVMSKSLEIMKRIEICKGV